MRSMNEVISTVISVEQPVIFLVFVNETQLDHGPRELPESRAGVEAGKRDGVSQRGKAAHPESGPWLHL